MWTREQASVRLTSSPTVFDLRFRTEQRMRPGSGILHFVQNDVRALHEFPPTESIPSAQNPHKLSEAVILFRKRTKSRKLSSDFGQNFFALSKKSQPLRMTGLIACNLLMDTKLNCHPERSEWVPILRPFRDSSQAQDDLLRLSNGICGTPP